MKYAVVRFAALIAAAHTLTACMYYADFDRKRADTEQTRQRTAIMQAYGDCLRENAKTPEKCPKPNF